MASIRQQIVDNLMGRFAAMSTSTGYSANYATVDTWHLTELEPADLPAVIVFDTTSELTNSQFTNVSRKADYQMEVVVGLFVSGDTSPTDARNIISDIYQCVGADISCDGLTSEIRPVSETLFVSQKNVVLGDIQLTFHILYST